MTNIAVVKPWPIEIDDFPMNTSIYKGFSMAMLNNQMIYIYIYNVGSINGHGKDDMKKAQQ